MSQPTQEIDFQPEKRTIEDLFVGPEYFVIPRFQRPYSWDAENLDSFWRDVLYDNRIGYFIGPMVAWSERESPIRRVVDGQQRLTTIAILFAVLRDEFVELGERGLADGVHRYLEKADRNYVKRYTLQAEIESQYLGQAIFKDPPERTIQAQTEEETALSKALDGIRKRVREEVAQRQDPKDWLVDLRDRVLGLRVIWIEHGNEDDAYVIFETLNSRGKDLEVVDLLKNHLLSRLRSSGNPAADASRTKWEQMRNELESSDSRRRIDPNRFILHWWLSQEDYVAERKLYSAVKQKVKSESGAQRCLDSLLHDAPLYRVVAEPSSKTWPNEETRAGRSLAALALFGVVQPAPLLLSLLRARTDSVKLGAAQFNNTLQVIERFHFQHTMVSQLRSSGGVSEMYARAARRLHSAGNDNQKRADALKELRGKLIERIPDRDQFILAFQERFFFTSAYTRESKLIRYVLESFLRELHPTTGTENLTIEHLMPQSAMKTGEQFETVGALGNLLLVSESLNTALSDKGFAAKKKTLASVGGQPYDIGMVLDATQWTRTEIEGRTGALAERAYDSTWRLPL